MKSCIVKKTEMVNFSNIDDFNCYHFSKCKNAEREVVKIDQKVYNLKFPNPELLLEETEDKELSDLLQENKKLKYRISIMKKAIEECSSIKSSSSESTKKMETLTKINKSDANISILDKFDLTGSHMVNVLGYIEVLLKDAIVKAFPEASQEFTVQIQISKLADYQCSAAMALAKIVKKNPKDVGQKIINLICKNPVVQHLEISGPGFINIYLSQDFISQQVSNLIKNGVTPPTVLKKKVVVDFSSPNIAKEMHVGHLRSTIIGDCLCRLFEFLGYDVMRLNHLGDWGTQFGMLIAHMKDKFPDLAHEMPPIRDLQTLYKESKLRFDMDPDFKRRAYDTVVQLQAQEDSIYKTWRHICNISMEEFQKIYDLLNITIIPRGESFYQSRMEKLVKELEANGFLSLEDGRKVMYADGADIPLTLVKSDGGFTYDTSDLACIKQRLEEENATWLVYVTDVGQSQHFKSILACAKRAGIYDPSTVRIDHVTFGVVLGPDKKKFKTRSGDTIRLMDLLKEGIERAEMELIERGRQHVLTEEEFKKVKTSVAYGCIKYADLSHDRTRDYIFSFDRMVDFRGNTASYLLYALTRIRSISRNAGIDRATLLKHLEKQSIELKHEYELKLAKTLLKLPDIIVKLTHDLHIHLLCEFLYEISSIFTDFYSNCYCIEKDSSGKVVKIYPSRLLLCEATAIVMDKCLDILGIESLEKM